ncbi:MAG: Asp/Glu racemase [Salaquimonas sp.]
MNPTSHEIIKLKYVEQTYVPIGKAVGLILLQTDEVLENEIRSFLPEKMVLFHSRVPSGDEVTTETLAKMEAEIPRATSLFPPAGDLAVVAYCCTSGSTVIGEDKVAAAIHSVRPNVKVTNPLTAVKANLHHVDAKRIGLLTPYEPHVSEAMAQHFKISGFEITSFGSFYEKEEAKVTRISQASILDAIVAIGSGDQCDAVFASCTNLRTAEILAEASRRIGKPVISSNSALAWHISGLLSENSQ